MRRCTWPFPMRPKIRSQRPSASSRASCGAPACAASICEGGPMVAGHLAAIKHATGEHELPSCQVSAGLDLIRKPVPVLPPAGDDRYGTHDQGEAPSFIFRLVDPKL